MANSTQGQRSEVDVSPEIDRYPYDTPYCHRTFLSSLSPALNNLLLIKRSPTPDEYPLYDAEKRWKLRHYKEALRNEAAAVEFVKLHTTIPVPSVVAAFEDRDSFYIMMEKVQDAICLMDVPLDKREPVYEEMDGYIAQLRSLRSSTFGGVKGDTFLPARIADRAPIGWSYLAYEANSKTDYTFCHGDLHCANVLVDPTTFKIKGIIDWECAGFYPGEFERRWYLRDGPAEAVGDEHDDSEELMQKLYSIAHPASVQKAKDAEALDWDGVWETEKEQRRASVPSKPTRRLIDARVPPRLHLVQDLDFAIVDVYRLLSHVMRGTRTPFSQLKGLVAPPVLTTAATNGQNPTNVLARERTLEIRRGDQEAIKLVFRLVDVTMAARKAFPSIRALMDRSLKKEAEMLEQSRQQSGNLPIQPGTPGPSSPAHHHPAGRNDQGAEQPARPEAGFVPQAVAQRAN